VLLSSGEEGATVALLIEPSTSGRRVLEHRAAESSTGAGSRSFSGYNSRAADTSLAARNQCAATQAGGGDLDRRGACHVSCKESNSGVLDQAIMQSYARRVP
jgi:hypothetical protein